MKMKSKSGFTPKILAGVVTAAAVTQAVAASAYTISFGFQEATDGSGKTSALINSDNETTPDLQAAGFFIETFDEGTGFKLPNLGSNGFGGATAGTTGDQTVTDAGGTISQVTGTFPDENFDDSPIEEPEDGWGQCSINAWGGPEFSSTGSATEGNRFGVTRGSIPGAAAPANNTTCYAYGPGTQNTSDRLPASLAVDFTPVFDSGLFGVDTITYLGLYYGSIDTYNNINFMTAFGGSFTVTGASILAAENGVSGNQAEEGSNVYVNLEFPEWWRVVGFEFETTGIAYEFDNVVVQTTKLPAPATLGLIGVGLLGLGRLSRRRKS